MNDLSFAFLQPAMPAGVTRDFTATTFIVQNQQTLLLLHRKLEKWFPPGGHIEPNELPHFAAIREVREETGFEVELLTQSWRLGPVCVLPQPQCILLENISETHQHIDLIFFAKVSGGMLAPSIRESQATRWFSWDDLGEPDIAEDICHLGRMAIEQYET